MEDLDIHELFSDVAWAVKATGWTIEHDDLVQELWLWLFERESRRSTLLGISDPKKRRAFVKKQAFNIAVDKVREDMLFNAKYDYSIDVCKMILKGEITGDQSVEDLALAIENLRAMNEDYASILIKRYYSEEDLTSYESKTVLPRAHIRLTDEMNRIARERAAEFEEVPGGTLADGLGRPKPIPFKIEDIQPVPEVARGYYERRTPDNIPRIPRHDPQSLRDIRRS